MKKCACVTKAEEKKKKRRTDNEYFTTEKYMPSYCNKNAYCMTILYSIIIINI